MKTKVKKKKKILWLLAVPNSAPTLSLGLNWFRVQYLFLVTSLSWVRVQSCERAKKLDLGGVCFFLA